MLPTRNSRLVDRRSIRANARAGDDVRHFLTSARMRAPSAAGELASASMPFFANAVRTSASSRMAPTSRFNRARIDQSPSASCNALGFAQALDQRRAQEKRARKLGVFRGPAQFVVVVLAHRRIFFCQKPLVADGLRLGVLQCDVPALALVA